MRVLVVDDDLEFAEDLVESAPPGMEVETAGGTDEAFELLHEYTPDAIVLDLQMLPVLATDASNEGLAVLGAVTGGHKGAIPVVIATDRSSEEAGRWCRRLGAAAVLDKGDGLSRILSTVAEVVAAKAGSRATQIGEERLREEDPE